MEQNRNLSREEYQRWEARAAEAAEHFKRDIRGEGIVVGNELTPPRARKYHIYVGYETDKESIIYGLNDGRPIADMSFSSDETGRILTIAPGKLVIRIEPSRANLKEGSKLLGKLEDWAKNHGKFLRESEYPEYPLAIKGSRIYILNGAMNP